MEEKKSEKFSAVRDYDGFVGVRVYRLPHPLNGYEWEEGRSPTMGRTKLNDVASASDFLTEINFLMHGSESSQNSPVSAKLATIYNQNGIF